MLYGLELDVEAVLELTSSIADQPSRLAKVLARSDVADDIVGCTAGSVARRAAVQATGPAVHAGGKVEVALIRAKIGMVEQIESVKTKLHGNPLTGLPVLIDGKVCVDETRAVAVTTRCSVRLERAKMVADQRDGVGVDDLIALDVRGAPSIRERPLIAYESGLEQSTKLSRAWGQHLLSRRRIEDGSHIRCVLPDTVLENRERVSRVGLRNAGQLPSAERLTK